MRIAREKLPVDELEVGAARAYPHAQAEPWACMLMPMSRLRLHRQARAHTTPLPVPVPIPTLHAHTQVEFGVALDTWLGLDFMPRARAARQRRLGGASGIISSMGK